MHHGRKRALVRFEVTELSVPPAGIEEGPVGERPRRALSGTLIRSEPTAIVLWSA